MKKKMLALLLACVLLLSACGSGEKEDGKLQILATTYPVYLFATAVTEGVSGVEVRLLVNQPTSCLHDYTLTVGDMKAIEQADVIAMNGVGLEDFMADALAQTKAETIDCSAGIALLLAPEHEGHDGHDHAEEYDPHIWMAPEHAKVMMQNLADGLSAMDKGHGGDYAANCAAAIERLDAGLVREDYLPAPQAERLITFHNGFQYFAAAFGFHIERAVEEEEGSEASAHTIREIVALITQYDIPAIFTEINGSSATADAIARETGVQVYPLSMLMSGDGTGIEPYIEVIRANYDTLAAAFTREGT